jgi:hypothetical protein
MLLSAVVLLCCSNALLELALRLAVMMLCCTHHDLISMLSWLRAVGSCLQAWLCYCVVDVLQNVAGYCAVMVRQS